MKFKGDSLCSPLLLRGGLIPTDGTQDPDLKRRLAVGIWKGDPILHGSEPEESRALGLFASLLPLHKIKKTSPEMRGGEKEEKERGSFSLERK